MRLDLDFQTREVGMDLPQAFWAPVDQLPVAYGPGEPWRVVFRDGVVPNYFMGLGSLAFVAKPLGKFDGDPWVLQDMWPATISDEVSDFSALVAFNSDAIKAALADNGSDSDDVEEVALEGAFRFYYAEGGIWESRWLPIVVRNSPFRPSDTPPVPTAGQSLAIRDLSLAVSTADFLALPSAGWTTGQVFSYTDAGSGLLTFYRLIVSIDATSLPSLIRAPDWDLNANPRAYALESVGAGGAADYGPHGGLKVPKSGGGYIELAWSGDPLNPITFYDYA